MRIAGGRSLELTEKVYTTVDGSHCALNLHAAYWSAFKVCIVVNSTCVLGKTSVRAFKGTGDTARGVAYQRWRDVPSPTAL